MSKDLKKYNPQDIVNRIFSIRDSQVMLDTHLAEMYGVETRRLNEQIQRNIDPESFRFQLTEEEYGSLRSQFAISSSLKDLGKKWFVFSLMDKDAFAVIERINAI